MGTHKWNHTQTQIREKVMLFGVLAPENSQQNPSLSLASFCEAQSVSTREATKIPLVLFTFRLPCSLDLHERCREPCPPKKGGNEGMRIERCQFVKTVLWHNVELLAHR